MSGPPANVEAVTLWQRLAASERPRRRVPFPRNGKDGKPLGEIDIVILTQAQVMLCTAAAEGYAREMLKDQKSPNASQGYYDLYNDARIIELLWHACKQTEDPSAPEQPAFGRGSKDVRTMLSVDEVTVLFQAYTDWQTESGPIIADMTQEEMDAWIDRLKEAGSRLPLPAHSLAARTDLLMRSIARLARSETVSISSGAQPESSSESPPAASAEAVPAVDAS